MFLGLLNILRIDGVQGDLSANLINFYKLTKYGKIKNYPTPQKHHVTKIHQMLIVKTKTFLEMGVLVI